jgi:hypothetical protein
VAHLSVKKTGPVLGENQQPAALARDCFGIALALEV